jgi:hypothetical protein
VLSTTSSAASSRHGGDGRTLEGPLLPWGVEARVLDRGRLVTETFARGALVDADPSRATARDFHEPN